MLIFRVSHRILRLLLLLVAAHLVSVYFTSRAHVVLSLGHTLPAYLKHHKIASRASNGAGGGFKSHLGAFVTSRLYGRCTGAANNSSPLVHAKDSIANLHLSGANCKSKFGLGLFEGIFSWVNEALGGGWYVPPMPTGKKASQKLREEGPLQTDEESRAFLGQIGASEDATLVDIGGAFQNALNTLPEDMHNRLHKMFAEYIRKEMLGAFEHLESYMDKGPEAWKEYWNPKRDIFGNLMDKVPELSPEEEQKIRQRIPPEIFNETDQKEWEKQSTRFRKMVTRLDLPGLIRFTRDFRYRLKRCIFTMIPTLFLSFVPKMAPLAISIQALFASKFMLDGDRELVSAESQELSQHEINPSILVRRSITARTIVTMLVVLLHSSVGVMATKLLSDHTNILDVVTPEVLKAFLVNFWLLLAALFYDTSNMSPLQQQLRREAQIRSHLLNSDDPF